MISYYSSLKLWILPINSIEATVAHKCHDKTKKPRQNQNATAKPKSYDKTKKSRQTKKATAKQKIQGQNEKATAK